MRSAVGTAGMSGAEKISRSPGKRTTPAGWLRSTMPATASRRPGSTSRPRGHAPPANRINPRAVSSTLVRTNLRTRRFWVGRVSEEPRARSAGLAKDSISPGSAGALAASSQPPAPGSVLRVANSTPVRSGEAGCATWESRARSARSVPAPAGHRRPRPRAVRVADAGGVNWVGVRGLEPRTSSLSGRRSNRLSYTPLAAREARRVSRSVPPG